MRLDNANLLSTVLSLLKKKKKAHEETSSEIDFLTNSDKVLSFTVELQPAVPLTYIHRSRSSEHVAGNSYRLSRRSAHDLITSF